MILKIILKNYAKIHQSEEMHDSITQHKYCKQHFNRKHLVKIPATKLWLIK